ncbi:MAG: nitroreductase family protein [Candidatus Eremiobacterota bacterium]
MKKNDNTPSHHGVKIPVENNNYPNETIKLLIERGSCRNFSNKKIAPQVLDFILNSGIHAPTGGNLQPYSIIKIEDKEKRHNLAEMCEQIFMAKAPVHLLFCIDWHRLKRWAELETAPFSATSSFRHFWISFQDVIICAQNICTAADSLGLGSVYIGTVVDYIREIKAMFELPQEVYPVVLLCLGYPNIKPSVRKKLPPSVIVHNERYNSIDDTEILKNFNEKYEYAEIKITEERMKDMEETCREVHGEEFAKKCIEKIKKTGYITQVQRYFGLHYRANEMPLGNKEYLKTFKEAGFSWFEEFILPEPVKNHFFSDKKR